MATYIHRLYSTVAAQTESQTGSFSRRHRAVPIQKNRARRRLRAGHVIMLLGLQAVFFLGLREAYLFTITWNELNIRKVEIECGLEPLKSSLEEYFTRVSLGNILLADLDAVRNRLKELGWIKDVRVQKVFPSTLRLEIIERKPFALLVLGGLRLVDENGVIMEKVFSPDERPLPLVSDEGRFLDDFPEKWRRIRDCLEDLPAAERERLAEIRYSDYGSLELYFKDDPTRIFVGVSNPAGNLAYYREREQEWKRDFGPLEYADVSIENRAFLKVAAATGERTLDQGD